MYSLNSGRRFVMVARSMLARTRSNFSDPQHLYQFQLREPWMLRVWLRLLQGYLILYQYQEWFRTNADKFLKVPAIAGWFRVYQYLNGFKILFPVTIPIPGWNSPVYRVPCSKRKFARASKDSKAAGIVTSIQNIGLFIDQMKKNRSHCPETFRVAFIFGILESMPVWVIKINDVYSRDANF